MHGAYKFNYHGMIVPIEPGGGDDLNPNIVVRIIPELNQPFNTKMRAPFKIVCEVIKYNELKAKEDSGDASKESINLQPVPVA